MNLEYLHPPTLSLCITVMNRLHHLRQTLPKNIFSTRHILNREFVILDYSSKDGLRAWVKENLKNHLTSGTVSYALLRDRTLFHRSHAKNVAHRIARGDILCNLDADNFVTPEFASFLTNKLRVDASKYFRGRGFHTGRLAFTREDFFSLGGYDERLHGWGHEDVDLARRALLFGLASISRKNCGRIIRHDDKERSFFHETKNIRKSARQNQVLGKRSRDSGEVIANRGKTWGSAQILLNFKSESIFY